MLLKGLNHLAFITDDMTKTVRFYRDLLGLRLVAGIGHDGYRHYFFQMGTGQIAFFSYEGAQPMERKFHGSPTTAPLGFDHVALTVDSKEDLFAFKDKLEAAGVDTIKELRHRNADNLAEKMSEINGEKNLAKVAPAAKVVQGWIEAAKTMEPKISH